MVRKILRKPGSFMSDLASRIPWALVTFLTLQLGGGIWFLSGMNKDVSQLRKDVDSSNNIKVVERIVKLETQTEQVLDALQRIERRLDRPRRE